MNKWHVRVRAGENLATFTDLDEAKHFARERKGWLIGDANNARPTVEEFLADRGEVMPKLKPKPWKPGPRSSDGAGKEYPPYAPGTTTTAAYVEAYCRRNRFKA